MNQAESRCATLCAAGGGMRIPIEHGARMYRRQGQRGSRGSSIPVAIKALWAATRARTLATEKDGSSSLYRKAALHAARGRIYCHWVQLNDAATAG